MLRHERSNRVTLMVPTENILKQAAPAENS